jgi:hypothetical protein
MQHFVQGEPELRLDQSMNMVGHDAPRQKPIPLRIEVQQGAFDQLRHVRTPQPAFAMARVKVIFGSAAQFDRYGLAETVPQFGAPGGQDFPRERIA